MGQLFAIGELLIDFIPLEKGSALKDVLTFERAAGGAPANVAAAVSRLGGNAAMLTKLGKDAFGDYLIEQLASAGVHTGFIQRTTEANTGLAFVSLQEDGERDFSFYRNPSSDLLLSEAEIEPTIFQTDDILHFGSVDLVESPMKQAHLKAIHSVERQGGLISFDPNVRLPLWTSPDECRKTIQAFIPTAHILKISEDELEFITGIPSSEKAIAALFKGNVKAVVYTRGKNGADLYLSPEEKYQSQGFNVEVQDTTGAGDAFVGGLLYQLLDKKATQENVTGLLRRNHHEIMQFANATGAITTMKKGAIPALPNQMDVQRFIQQESNEGMITDV